MQTLGIINKMRRPYISSVIVVNVMNRFVNAVMRTAEVITCVESVFELHVLRIARTHVKLILSNSFSGVSSTVLIWGNVKLSR